MGWGTMLVPKRCVKCEMCTNFFFLLTNIGKKDRLACCGVTGGFVCCGHYKKKKCFRSSLADPISVAAQDVGQRGFLQYYYSFFRCTYYMAVFCVMTFLDSSLSLL